MFEREDRSLSRSDQRRTQTLKPKASASSADGSHIPRARARASSCDRASVRNSYLKSTGRTPLRQRAPTTPITPVGNKHMVGVHGTGSSNRIHPALPLGHRSPSGDRGSVSNPKCPKKDIRPLTDKNYQALMLSKIDNYFFENEAISTLNSNGSLKPVTLKMFVEVSAFLVKSLGIKQIPTIANYMEELPKIAKKFHYPGTMTKSWLKTANAMYAWPNVLGWLCWLVEILESKKLALKAYHLDNLPFLETEENHAEMNRHAFFSMLNIYNAWNDEKLDVEAELVAKYLKEMDAQQGITNDDLTTAHDELAKDIHRLQAIESNLDESNREVKHLEEVLSSLQEDESKQLSDIAASKEYIKEVETKTEHIDTECNAFCEQIRVLNIERDNLIAIIKQQPMSKAERDKILEKCTEIVNSMEQFDEHLKDLQKEVYSLDMKLTSVTNSLHKSVLAYNKEVLMHISDDVGVDLNEMKIPEEDVLKPHFMDVLNSKAIQTNNLMEFLRKQIAEQKASMDHYKNESDSYHDKIKVLQEEISDLTDKLRKKKQSIDKIKTEVRDEETELREQIKNLQIDIDKIQDSVPDLEKIQAQLEEATDKLNAVERKKAFIEQNAKIFFDAFYKLLGEHRNELYTILTKRNSNVSHK
ncbi:hypothetical protein KM043_015934 [Ampulex compressa]|nr:hypothetical protein KM043_015934 [Ampulex compressa]